MNTKSIYSNRGLSPIERENRIRMVKTLIEKSEGKNRKTLGSQLWRLLNPERVKQARKTHALSHREQLREKARKTNRRLKIEVLAHYSLDGLIKCECCLEEEIQFLSIDHIGGNGKAHRKLIGGAQALYPWLRRNGYPPGFRVLCFNCNLSLGFYGNCPHKRLGGNSASRLVMGGGGS